nr:MAG TPA: hypothetical protein [Caudoviricetes sp.]
MNLPHNYTITGKVNQGARLLITQSNNFSTHHAHLFKSRCGVLALGRSSNSLSFSSPIIG